MSMKCVETSQLVLDGQQMLKGTKGQRDQPKLLAKVKSSHVSLKQRYPRTNLGRFGSEPFAAPREHCVRRIDSRNLNAGTRRRYQDGAGTTTHHKQAPAALDRLVVKE